MAVLLASSAWPAQAQEDLPSRVLILQSYHHGLSWTDAVQRGIDAELAAFDAPVEMSVEYMDTKRHPVESVFDELARLYALKYARWKPDVIISCDDDALHFLFRYRNQLFPEVPVVFCGLNVDDYDPSMLEGHSGYTGVVERLDVASTINLIPELQPKVRNIAIIHDRTTTGLADRKTLEALASQFAPELRFVYLDSGRGLTEEELLNAVAVLPKDTAIYFVGFFRDKLDRPLALDYMLPKISQASSVPIYASAEAFFGYGILGGKLLCGEVHGASTTAKAVGILAGTNVADMPVTVESANRYMFDYRQMQRFDIEQSDLPEGSIVRFGPASFFARHRRKLLWALAGLIALLLFTAGLLINTFRRRVIERRLAASERRYRLLADHATDMISTHDFNGVYLYASPSCRRLLGYEPEELIGRNAYEFFHPDDVAHVRRGHDAIQEGKPLQTISYRIRHRDGHYLWVETTSRTIDGAATEGDGAIICGTRDVTERKRAEIAMAESKRTLQSFFETPHVAMAISRAADGVYLEANQAFLDLTGYSYDELIGRPSVELGFFTARQRQELARRVEQEGDLRNEQMTFRKKDGRERIILFSLHRISLSGEACFSAAMVDVTDRVQAEQALQESEQRYRRLVEQAPDIVYVYSTKRGAVFWSDRVKDILGHPPEGCENEPFLWFQSVHPDDREVLQQAIEKAQHGQSFDVEYRLATVDGEWRWLRDRSISSEIRDDECIIEGLATDITPRKQAEIQREALENQLRQAQKMEAVGRLAGGVAHDFNNSLQSILGYTDLLSSSLADEGEQHQWLAEIRNAASRSAALTKQLLAYARKQAYHPEPLDLNQTIESMINMLQRLIGDGIRLQWKPGPTWSTRLDPAQLDQVLTNLVLNARDAIDAVGQITITTDRQHVDGTPDGLADSLSAGDYTVLSVSDDGSGMGDEDLEHVFEPFFTTKPMGKGTGLGLATVYGIVKQNGGGIDVTSRKSVGTTFTIYLPRNEPEPPAKPEPRQPDAQSHAPDHRSVLVVEDDPAILKLAGRILQKLGYHILSASCPREAVEISADSDQSFQLLLTDVIMPEMTGRQLADQLIQEHPQLACVFMSGYPADAIELDGHLPDGVQFLQKPFTSDALRRAIQEASDESD